MKTRRTLLLLTAIACCTAAQAQHSRVVVDVETLMPIAGVNVVGSGAPTTTDSLGHYTMADSCRTLLFSHVNYESRLVNTDEIADTVFLISKLLNVKEVVVFGKPKPREDLKALKKRLKMEKTEAQLAAANPNAGFNILPLLSRLIPKKWQKNTKKARREKLKKTLEEY